MKETKKFLTRLLIVAYFISGCSTSKNIRFECPNIETDISGLKSNGSLILDGDRTYLMDMDSLTETEIKNQVKTCLIFLSRLIVNGLSISQAELKMVL